MADEKKNGLQVGGFAGWAIAAMQRGRARALARRPERTLELVETLSLGGKRSVAVVACDGQKFLVGMGAETVETIVPVTAPQMRSDVVQANWGAGF